ncbi:killer cell lectin-like receptor subfamily G member 2 isoform X2 [Ambystoma mexicanum]|uniref:killer cell lectin-like receptor subfamily G member 2 isoform X2 n=1 Tax=Ambystoma mexicanum TaxID=8296 RepID=UPI0037E809A0
MEALLSRGASVIIKAPEDEDPEKGGTLPNSITMSKCCALDRVDSGYLSAYNTVTLSSCSSDSLDALSLPGPGALDREAEPTAQAECEAGSQQLRGQGWRKRARSEDSGLGLPLFQDARNAGRDAGVNVTGYPLHPLARAGPRKKEKARTEGPGAHLQKLLPREVDTQPTETTAGDEKSSQKCLLPSKELRSDPYFMTVSLIAALLLLTVLILGAILSVKRSPPEVPTPPCIEATPPRVESCPMDWFYNGRTCYHFSKEEMEWEESQRFCSSYNASLALIDAQEELDFMLDLICRKHMWIGLRYSGTQFHWVNGTACNSTVGHLLLTAAPPTFQSCTGCAICPALK